MVKINNVTKILFAWDFHGVLEKDNEYSVQEICNRVLEEFGLRRQINLEETIKWYGLRWLDYFENLCPTLTKDELIKMVKRARELSKIVCKKYIKPMDHAGLVLKKIQGLGNQNAVISNSEQKRIEDFIKIVGLNQFVDFCVGIDKHLKPKDFDIIKEKAKIIKSFNKENNFKKLVMIGDNEEDIKAGTLCGATTYFFINRFNKSKAKNIKADYVISDLREVLKECSKYQ